MRTDSGMILDRTSGGLDVFVHYMGDACRRRGLFSNPFRRDTNASCKLYARKTRDGHDKYVLKDFGDSQWCGDCFWLVAKLTGLSLSDDFPEILDTIEKVLNLSDGSRPTVQPVEQAVCRPPLVARPVYQRMTAGEFAYWGRYGITRETLGRYHVRSVATCRLSREGEEDRVLRGTSSYPLFVYQIDEGRCLKFYRPGARVRFLYAGKYPRIYVFGLDQLPLGGRVLYVTGGEKDVMSLASHGLSAISLNSETARMPLELYRTLRSRFEHIVFLYDVDQTGRRESALRVSELSEEGGAYRLDLPLAGTKQEKDVSDFFRLGHAAEELIRLTNETILKTKEI